MGLVSLTDDLAGQFLDLWRELNDGAGEFYLFFQGERARCIEELNEPDVTSDDLATVSFLISDLKKGRPQINQLCSTGSPGEKPKSYTVTRTEYVHGSPVARLHLRPGSRRARPGDYV